MHDEDLHFDLIIASPASRSVETLDEAAHAYGAAEHRRLDESLYLASASSLLELVRSTSDDVESLLIVGHNPGLERLALMLSRSGGADRDRVAEKFPTGALIELAFDVDRWADVAEESGTITRFTTPKTLGSG
jgi:phosphohistidine phosphatase